MINIKISWTEIDVFVAYGIGILWRAARVFAQFSLISTFLSVEETTDKTHRDSVGGGYCDKESNKTQLQHLFVYVRIQHKCEI